MAFIQRIRSGPLVVRIYNRSRLVLAIIGPLFMLAGIADLFGIGTITLNGRVLLGIERVIHDILFILLGIIFISLRFTLFREKQQCEENGPPIKKDLPRDKRIYSPKN